jgi:glyoxylase-like metal-dependent hydrolase (beta-lactamase superfamily II)
MVKVPNVRLVLAAAAAAGLFVAHTQQPPAQPLTVTKVFDDLHVIVGSGGNVAVYDTSEGAILVDDKFAQNVPDILAKVKSVTDKPVRYLLNTHLHGDHTGGNARLMEQGVETVIHENGRVIMEDRKMPGQPRLSFSQQFSVRLGGKVVRARHFGRGHTNGDAVVYFPARKTVHMGDMFVAGTPFVDYSSGGSGVAWPATIDRVLELDFETVIPGHGPILKRADLVQWKQSWEKLREDLRTLKRDGRSKEEAERAVDLSKLPGWAPSPMWARSFPGLWDEIK